MRVRMDYGRTGLDVELPDRNVVKCLGYRPADPLPNPQQAVADKLAGPTGARPLSELAQGRRNACVVISDVTRPVPNYVILPPILRTLEQSGLADDQILIMVATGLHRPNVGDELKEMVGAEVYARYRIENHDGHDRSQHRYLGESPRGVPIWIDRRYVDADLKITTGLIEPHLMAGFSGGRKLICPGLAAFETIKAWHSPDFIEHPKACAGILQGNPVHEENTWIAKHVGCDLIVNTALDDQRRVLFVAAGDMEEAFLEGVAFVRNLVTDRVAEPVDVVVTSSAGHPLDATYYQSVKGMVAALEVVKPGGTVILVARIAEGIGSTEFQRLLEEHETLEGFMECILNTDYFVLDQWQLEELAKVRRKAKVRVVTEGLSPDRLDRFFVRSSPSVETAVADALAEYGPDATIAAIPKGPYVLAQVERH